MAAIEELMSPEEQRQLLDLRADAKQAWSQYYEAREVAKSAKAKAEGADKEVEDFLDAYGDIQGRGLLKGQAIEQANGDATPPPVPCIGPPPTDGDAPAPDSAPSVGPPADGEDGYDLASSEDRWKFVQVDVLREHGAKPGDVAKLNEAAIKTLGDIVEFTKDGVKRLTDIKGIGETANDRIIDALVAYHEANPAKAPETPPDASGGEDVQTEAPEAGGPAEGEQGAADAKPSRRRRRKPDPEPAAPEDDGLSEPADKFDPPSGEFDPNSDSQRNDHDDD